MSEEAGPAPPGEAADSAGAVTAVGGLLGSVVAAAMLGAAIIGSDPYRHVAWIEPVFNVAAVVWLIGACLSLLGVIMAARARTVMEKRHRVAATVGLVITVGTFAVLVGGALGLAWGSW